MFTRLFRVSFSVGQYRIQLRQSRLDLRRVLLPQLCDQSRRLVADPLSLLHGIKQRLISHPGIRLINRTDHRAGKSFAYLLDHHHQQVKILLDIIGEKITLIDKVQQL